jgi:hypothetical protein
MKKHKERKPKSKRNRRSEQPQPKKAELPDPPRQPPIEPLAEPKNSSKMFEDFLILKDILFLALVLVLLIGLTAGVFILTE